MSLETSTGVAYDSKEESVPLYDARDGDLVINGQKIGDLATGKENNNAWIVLGRDRFHSAASGYGGIGHQRAGAIDIVVGRMAPLPMSHFPDEPEMTIPIDPIFKSMQGPQLLGVKMPKDPTGDQKTPITLTPKKEDAHLYTRNPAVDSARYQDAARIYISQKCDIDHYFGLAAGIKVPSPGHQQAPRSAIAMQADGVRIIAREGIKLVTIGAHGYGRNEPTHNSQGGLVKAVQGIELIAGNGRDANGAPLKQEPLIKGYQLCKALTELAEEVSTISGILAKFTTTQLSFNKAMMTHVHGETFLGAITLTSPQAIIAGAQSIVDTIATVNTSILNDQSNLATWSSEYLGDGSGTILSKFNTTN
jgi:hypothetical protein